jgi:hypothetical protein
MYQGFVPYKYAMDRSEEKDWIEQALITIIPQNRKHMIWKICLQTSADAVDKDQGKQNPFLLFVT